jgi:hypothetical protein
MADANDADSPLDRVFTIEVDWHLQLLVEDANDFGVEIPITLFVSGAVVTGVLTSGKVYFDRFAERFAAGWPEEAREKIRASMAMPGDVYPRLEPGEKSPRKRPAQFIHLRDAQIVTALGNLPVNGDPLLWRGRLTEVGGYSIGHLAWGALPPGLPTVRRSKQDRRRKK